MRRARRRLFIRTTLGWLLANVLAARAGPIFESAPVFPAAREAATLRAYVDALIPADESPSGTALGVDAQLMKLARGERSYHRLLELGFAWLNGQARAQFGRDFADLRESECEAVISHAANADLHTLPRVFFERTRADAFLHYYARPESWRTIRYYGGPPQPLGFIDYTQPPRPLR